jgi:serpin B
MDFDMPRLPLISLALICMIFGPACDRKAEKDEAEAGHEAEAASDEPASDEQEPEQSVDEEQKPEKERQMHADLSPDARAAQSSNEFGHVLLGRLEEGNAALSPASISTAVAMAYAGAGGETAAQLAEVMRYPEDAVAGFGALSTQLKQRNEKKGKEATVTLQLANDVWMQTDFAIKDAYVTRIESHYGAKPRQVNFTGAPKESRNEINSYVAQQTHDKIPELLPDGIIEPTTRAILTNAIYLKAAWKSPFEEDATASATFNTPSGEVEAQMMHQTTYFQRASGQDFEALEMPYVGENLAALVVLPNQGRLEDVQKSFDATAFASAIDDLKRTYVDFAMPKFKVRRSSMLKPHLKAMGAPLAFSNAADFDAMHPDLAIAEVVHEAFIDVDEKGTEAAAATAVVMGLRGISPKAQEFVVDRPFLFYVYDKPTGAILFTARVVDPTK